MVSEYRSLKDHVYDYIVKMIDMDMIGNEGKLSEQHICDALDVSRTPVREALIQLAADGYLENIPRRGFFIKRIDENSARYIFVMMRRPQGCTPGYSWAASDVYKREVVVLLHGAMQLAIEKGLCTRYDELQHDFHSCFVDKCGNDRLIALIHQLNRSFVNREYTSVAPDELDRLLRKANDEHAEIVRLFEQRDGAALQRYICDTHWSIDNASSLAW